MKCLTFLLYTLAWQSFVWGGCWWLIFRADWSAWTILLAIWFSTSQYKPARWAEIGD